MARTTQVRLEFKIEDLWIGAFWRRSTENRIEVDEDSSTAVQVKMPRLDVWICFFPCLPLHFIWTGEESRSESMRWIDDKPIAKIAQERGWKVLHAKESIDPHPHWHRMTEAEKDEAINKAI